MSSCTPFIVLVLIDPDFLCNVSVWQRAVSDEEISGHLEA